MLKKMWEGQNAFGNGRNAVGNGQNAMQDSQNYTKIGQKLKNFHFCLKK